MKNLRPFAMELRCLVRLLPYDIGNPKPNVGGSYNFEAGIMREDAPLPKAKRVKLNSQSSTSARQQEAPPEHQSIARSRGAPVSVTIAKASLLPKFITRDQRGQQVSPSIVDYDLDINTVDIIAGWLWQHEHSVQSEVDRHNSEVIICAARNEVYMAHCTEVEKETVRKQSQTHGGRMYAPVLFDNIDGLLWKWESSSLEVLTKQAEKYVARITELNAAGREKL